MAHLSRYKINFENLKNIISLGCTIKNVKNTKMQTYPPNKLFFAQLVENLVRKHKKEIKKDIFSYLGYLLNF